jgi:hypothetical protein
MPPRNDASQTQPDSPLFGGLRFISRHTAIWTRCTIVVSIVKRICFFAALQQQKKLAEAVDAAFGDSKLSADEQSLKIQEYFMLAAQLGWFTR